jgi:hypothetical protein
VLLCMWLFCECFMYYFKNYYLRLCYIHSSAFVVCLLEIYDISQDCIEIFPFLDFFITSMVFPIFPYVCPVSNMCRE